jgi:hypothetical protein
VSINKPPIFTSHLFFHARAIRHSGTKVLVTSIVAILDRFDLWFRIRHLPASAIVRVREGVAVVLVDETGDKFECNAVIERDLDHLAIGPYIGRSVSLFHRGLDGLQQRRLPVPGMTVVLLVDRIRKLKDHVQVTKSVDGRAAPVRADVEAVRRVGRRIPIIGVESFRDLLVPVSDRSPILDLQVRAKRAEPLCDSHTTPPAARRGAIRT